MSDIFIPFPHLTFFFAFQDQKFKSEAHYFHITLLALIGNVCEHCDLVRFPLITGPSVTMLSFLLYV